MSMFFLTLTALSQNKAKRRAQAQPAIPVISAFSTILTKAYIKFTAFFLL
jgi:hypothetical protein